jgi:hypothetical protein
MSTKSENIINIICTTDTYLSTCISHAAMGSESGVVDSMHSGPGRKSGPRGKRGVAPNPRSITVASLIDQGLITEGATVKVSHRGESAEGLLQKDGSVVMGEEKFASCAEFSTAVKRKSQPNCRSDDGWRSCQVNGRTLNDYRDEILEG